MRCRRLLQLCHWTQTWRRAASRNIPTILCSALCLITRHRGVSRTHGLSVLFSDVSVFKHIWQSAAFTQLLPPALRLNFLSDVPVVRFNSKAICANCHEQEWGAAAISQSPSARKTEYTWVQVLFHVYCIYSHDITSLSRLNIFLANKWTFL